jgi:ankyrin repeat protein
MAEFAEIILGNPDEDVNYADPKLGWTALIWAASRGHLDVCRMLVDHGADVNKTTKHKFSARLAAYNGQYPDVDEFLRSVGGKYHP